MDRHLLERAGRGLICALVCPIRVGVESYICQAEHCQEENEIGRSEVGLERRVGKEEAEGLLELGSSLLGMGTRWKLFENTSLIHIAPIQALGRHSLP